MQIEIIETGQRVEARKFETKYVTAAGDEYAHSEAREMVDVDFAVEDEWEDGGPRCSDPRGHNWVVSDFDENYCYCSRCGVVEY